MSTFSQWSLMDPARLRKEANTLFGSTVIDNFAILDPKRFEDQVNAHLGAPAVYRKSGPKDRHLYDPHWTPSALATAYGGTP